MDDILASIRRILDEEGQKTEDAPKLAERAPADAGGVLALDEFMVPGEGGPAVAAPPAAMAPAPVVERESAAVPARPAPLVEEPDPFDAAPFVPMAVPVAVPEPVGGYEESAPLVAPAAAAAAAVSVGALMRTLATERSTAVHRGGPTIEDLVREEIRPLLKEWLDAHLPPLVERLVRAEIERVVSRMT